MAARVVIANPAPLRSSSPAVQWLTRLSLLEMFAQFQTSHDESDNAVQDVDCFADQFEDFHDSAPLLLFPA